MRKFLYLFAFGSIFHLNLRAQNIYSLSPIVLPQSGSSVYTVAGGQTVNIISSKSVTLSPGTTLQAGSTVYIGVNPGLIIPASSNPADDFAMNWVMTRTYDEDGKETSAAKNFFDNSGKALQSQVKVESMGHVLASEPLYDFWGRNIGSTLSAPTNNAAFAYRTDFVRNSNDTKYNYLNFDGDPGDISGNPFSKTNNPDPVSSATPGTLGWYYSDNNNLEPMVPSTSLPYSRSDLFHDGSGVVKASGGVGDILRMGSGKEISSASVPVINELNNYLQIRNKFNGVEPLGATPASLASSALQTISKDANGMQVLSITDLSGKTLMTARAASTGELSVTNTFSLNQPSNLFRSKVTFGVTTNTLADDNIIGMTIFAQGSFNIYRNGTLLTTASNTYRVTPDAANNNAVFEIQSSSPFYYFCTKTNYKGTNPLPNTTIGNFYALKEEMPTSNTQFFYLTTSSAVNVTGLCSIYDMKTEAKLTSFTSGQVLPAGYYKAVTTNNPDNPTSIPATVTYTNRFTDIGYSFYNRNGQLISAIPPSGVQAYLANPTGYTNAFSIPFATRNEYDLQGRLIASTSADAGRSEIIYRTDGKVRFSQNAAQRVVTNGNERFSYTNYDELGRPVEAGEYIVPTTGSLTFASAKSNATLIANTAPGGGLSGGTKQDQVNTYYDLPATNLSLTGYVQDAGYLNSSISYTQNANSTTWYNYDGQGRLSWVVKQLAGIAGYKTIDYTYNAQGKIIKVDYQKNIAAERFIHYYDYNTDGRLVNVQTSRDDVNKVQQAAYTYYLHGPLKRAELAGDLQGIDYAYTPQGWLKSINTPTGVPSKDAGKDGDTGSSFAPDVFGMQMEYFPGDYNRTGSNITGIPTAQAAYYDGNVNGISWQSKATTGGASNPVMYTYSYDPKYQLNAATWGTPSFTTPSFTAGNMFKEYGITYDPNGNIKSLLRTDNAGNPSDNFNNYQYQANTNKLTGVGTTAAPGSYATYTYDEIGQLKSQAKSGNTTYIKYDVTGKIVGVYSNPGFTGTALISYSYDESGNRIKSVTPSATTYYVFDASGNVIALYTGTNGNVMSEVPVYGTERIGMFTVVGNNYRYELRDNVGSVRVVINRTKVSGQADVVTYSDYYPFGTKARGSIGDYRYEYQGLYAEKDPVTGYNNFDLRMYDARIGRWMSTDPKGQYASPYLGMGNNPVTHSDPDGGEDGPEDWVKGKTGIYWDPNAKSIATTKQGETYLGPVLTFNFTSYIDGKLWDGPFEFAAGNKLTSVVKLIGIDDSKGNLKQLFANYEVIPGPTPVGSPRLYYPGLPDNQNKWNFNTTSASSGNLNFEQHASVSTREEYGLNMMGLKIVNVAQKLTIDINEGRLKINAYTDIFPSASLRVNNILLTRYNQPSFRATHSAPLIADVRLNEQYPSVPVYDVSYLKAKWFRRF